MLKRTTVFLVLVLAPMLAQAQLNAAYTDAVRKAMEYYDAKEYLKSGQSFSVAFAALGGKAIATDRYNAACSWAMAGNKDSAFFHLNRLAAKA